MKKILLTLLVGFLVMACSESSNSVEPTPSPENDKISFASGTSLSPIFDVEGGTVSISFTASKSWTASLVNNRADGWCKVEPTSGSAGTHSINIKVSPNEEPDDKSAVVQIKSGNATESINVSQKQKNALTLTSDKYEVDAKGGSVEVEIKANVKYSYVIDEAAKEWIAYESSRALTTSYLKFKIAENEKMTTREGTIIITDGTLAETVTIYQQGDKPSIVISQKEYTIGANEDTIQVEVSSNVDVEMQIPDVDWITENQSRAYSTNTYHFIVSANETYDNRSAEIVFKNVENNLEEKVVINQVQRNAIVLAKNEYIVEKEACQLDFDIQANVDFEVKVEAEWIKQVQSRGLSSHSLYFDVAENTGDDEREGKIIISSGDIEQEIKVIQKGKKVDVEKIAEYVVEVSEKVDPLFMECETIEELAVHLDEIKKLEGVADAWVTNTALFVETEGGFPLSWLYTPDVDEEKEAIETVLSNISIRGLVESRNIFEESHKYMKDFNRVCILNQQADDESRHFLRKQYMALETIFENAGFEVMLKNGEEINTGFLRDSLTTYDIVHSVTHGVYDVKNNCHWIASGECVYDEWKTVVKMGEDGIKGYLIGSVKEIRKGKEVEVKYICFSEDFIRYSIRGKFNNSLIFNSACQSLKGINSVDNYSLANAFIERGAGAYWGYNETNFVGKMVGIQLYNQMLQGKTIQDAYNVVPKKDVNAQLRMILGDDDNMNICIVHPVIETLDVIEIEETSVTLNGRIIGWRNLSTEIGFCYSKDNEIPDVKNGISYDKIDYSNKDDININFNSVALDGLEPGTTYYYRAYMNINGQYIYGDVKNFTTTKEETTGVAEAVDLGLSVLWASCNVGATKPEEYGGYYAWGETKEKKEYTLWNYEFYNLLTGRFTDIGKDISGTKYDVAKKLGEGWRMPTIEEFIELTQDCEWTDSICNGIKGKKVLGENGNSIFLPLAGVGEPISSVIPSGEYGFYWSSNKYDERGVRSCHLSPQGVALVDCDAYYGLPIRPVKDK